MLSYISKKQERFNAFLYDVQWSRNIKCINEHRDKGCFLLKYKHASIFKKSFKIPILKDPEVAMNKRNLVMRKNTFEGIYIIEICYVIDKMLPEINIPKPFTLGKLSFKNIKIYNKTTLDFNFQL